MCLLGKAFYQHSAPQQQQSSSEGVLGGIKFLFVVQTYICTHAGAHTPTCLLDFCLNLAQGSTGQDLGLPKGPKGIGLEGVPWQLSKGTPNLPILPPPQNFRFFTSVGCLVLEAVLGLVFLHLPSANKSNVSKSKYTQI